MTKEAALKDFFNRFGVPAYPVTAVPADVIFPYITYTLVTDSFDGMPVSLTVNIWDYATGESRVNGLTRQMSEALSNGGATIGCDEGFIWLTRGTPWCQAIRDDSDSNLKGRYLNVTAEFNTFF